MGGVWISGGGRSEAKHWESVKMSKKTKRKPKLIQSER